MKVFVAGFFKALRRLGHPDVVWRLPLTVRGSIPGGREIPGSTPP
jgi:hypothetical protein